MVVIRVAYNYPHIIPPNVGQPYLTSPNLGEESKEGSAPLRENQRRGLLH